MPCDDIFDPRHYARVKLSLDRAETLPPWCYYNENFFRREVDQVLLRSWYCVGRVDRVRKAGDYVAFDLVGVPVILLRDREGQLRGFLNSCRHRGTQLLQGEGHCTGIKCPYHGWGYSLDGRLAGAPEMEYTSEFNKDDYGLIAIRLETCEGFVFLNFDNHAAGLKDHLGDFPSMHANYRLTDMACVRRKEYEVNCNWKLFIEIFMEYYHLKAVHPKSLDMTDHQSEDPDPVAGQYATQFGSHSGSSALIPGGDRRAFPSIEGLTGKYLGGTRYTLVYPGLVFGVTTDSMWCFECYPIDAARTRFAMNMCFPKSTTTRTDFEHVAQGYYERWDTGIAEDNTVLERQQIGISSPFTRPGRLSHLEPIVGAFNQWIVAQVIENSAANDK